MTKRPNKRLSESDQRLPESHGSGRVPPFTFAALPRTQSSLPIPTRNPSQVSAGGRGTLLRSAPKRASSRQFPVLAVRSMCSQHRLSSSAPSSWNAQAPANAATGKPTRRTKSARPSTPAPARTYPSLPPQDLRPGQGGGASPSGPLSAEDSRRDGPGSRHHPSNAAGAFQKLLAASCS